MITVYLHPRCSDSYKVFMFLKEKNYLDKVKVVNTERQPLLAVEKSVLGVPAFELDGEVVLQGWVSMDDVEEFFENGKVSVKDFDEGFDRLLKSVWSTFAVASVIFVAGTLDVLVGAERFLLSASGGFFLRDRDGFLRYLENRIRETGFDEVVRGLLRSILGNFLRDVYWMFGKAPNREFVEKLGFEFFRSWLYSRASIGRVFVPQSFGGADDRVALAWEYVLKRADRVGPEIVEEQTMLTESGFDLT